MPRDTQVDWQEIGATEPWYGVLSAEKYLKANLNAAAIEDFYEQGRGEIDEVVQTFGQHFGSFRPSRGVDFGCGLGRLTFAMTKHCAHVVGLDVSNSMLEEAERQRSTRSIRNASFQLTLNDSQRFDWINSYIVFQHIVPRQGISLLENLLRRLDVNGFVSVQLTYFHDSRHLTEITRDVAAYTFDGDQLKVLEEVEQKAGIMEMYDYDLNNIFRLFRRYGLDQTFASQTDHGGCHGLWLFGKKQR
jgi:trans-aconitate methyltransferase